MSIHQKLISGFVIAGLATLLVYPNSYAAAIATVFSLILYGFTIAADKFTIRKDELFELRIKEIEQKLSNLIIARGMGR